MIGGRLLGEQRHDVLSQLATRLCAVGVAAGILAALVLMTAKQFIIALFSRDPGVVAQLSDVWLLTAAMQPINALVFVSDGLLFAHQVSSAPSRLSLHWHSVRKLAHYTFSCHEHKSDAAVLEVRADTCDGRKCIHIALCTGLPIHPEPHAYRLFGSVCSDTGRGLY